ncbi:MAG: PocR ligand-binding domain-containing protein [Clostridia bacterium]|nr:PocR ligand-binding domain-containing protein [Clostridia bacterium]
MPLKIESEKINLLLESLYTLTDMTIGLYDENYNCIESYPLYSNRSRFCACIDKFSEFKQKCDECDKKYLLQAKKTKKPVIYKCHAGLVDLVFPLVQHDTVFGYVTMGQITDNPDLEFVRKHLYSYCTTLLPQNNDLMDYCKNITYKSEQHIQATITLLELSVNFILKNRFISSSDKDLFKEVSTYIEDNLDSDLSIERLCKVFNVGRTYLYTEIKKFFPDGIARFIKKKRLEKSCRLLTETNLSVNNIAETVGFNDYNYFLKIFKKEYGVTPKQFKKQLQ